MRDCARRLEAARSKVRVLAALVDARAEADNRLWAGPAFVDFLMRMLAPHEMRPRTADRRPPDSGLARLAFFLRPRIRSWSIGVQPEITETERCRAIGSFKRTSPAFGVVAHSLLRVGYPGSTRTPGCSMSSLRPGRLNADFRARPDALSVGRALRGKPCNL